MLMVKAGKPDLLREFEQKLLREGYVLVGNEVLAEDIGSKQYRLSPDSYGATSAIIWREES